MVLVLILCSIYNHRTIQILEKDPSLQASSPHPLAKSSKEVFNKLHNVQKRGESYSYKRSMKYVTPLDTVELKGVILLIYIQQFK